MKAGIYLEKEALEIWELDLPEIGDDDVLVQNICYCVSGNRCVFFLLSSPIPKRNILWAENLGMKQVSL